MTYTGDDGREHRARRDLLPPAMRPDARRLRYVTRRGCDGWPELGSCSGRAMKGCDYCSECETLRRAHEGGADLTDTQDEADD